MKQAIAIQRVIPFYRFFAADDRQFGTPRGALILHWVFTVIIILITPDTTDGYAFVVGLFTYGHILIGGKQHRRNGSITNISPYQ